MWIIGHGDGIPVHKIEIFDLLLWQRPGHTQGGIYSFKSGSAFHIGSHRPISILL